MIGLSNCRTSRAQVLAWRRSPNRFGPYVASRRAASVEVSPPGPAISPARNSASGTAQNSDGCTPPDPVTPSR